MRPANERRPATRGNAPAGRGKLSLRDGAEATLNHGHGQPFSVPADPVVVITLMIEPSKDAPGYFAARLFGADRVLAKSRKPFCDAARALLEGDHDPNAILEMRRPSARSWDLRAALHVVAGADVAETPFGPKFIRYRPTVDGRTGCNRSTAHSAGAEG